MSPTISRYFFRLEGVGPGLQKQAAQVELGLAERGVGVGDQTLGQRSEQQFYPGAEGLGEFLGLGPLLGR